MLADNRTEYLKWGGFCMCLMCVYSVYIWYVLSKMLTDIFELLLFDTSVKHLQNFKI